MNRRFIRFTLQWIAVVLLVACGDRAPRDAAIKMASVLEAQPLITRSASSALTLSVVEPADAKQAAKLGRYLVWVVQIDRNGQPFTVDTISIDGGMPGHGHGLPTQPRVTAQVGEGRYRVEGLKFTMPGRWVLHFDVSSKLGSDRFTLQINVGH